MSTLAQPDAGASAAASAAPPADTASTAAAATASASTPADTDITARCELRPAPIPGGMRELDRDAFKLHVPLSALVLAPRDCSVFLKRMHGYVFDLKRHRAIVNNPDDSSTKLLLLKPGLRPDTLPAELQAFLATQSTKETTYNLEIGYESWTAEQVLRAALPPEITEVTTSYEQIGHIAHMNLRDEQLPYKHLIGQVILDKNPTIQTVVNKLGNIHHTFRFFQMEVIAGAPDMHTSVRESGCIFKMDYSKVYWNSRLGHEHERIVKRLAHDDVVCDMFAGIGPFALPAGKKGCTVYANDLNPESFAALKDNIIENSVRDRVHAFNMDGRAFVRHLIGCALRQAEAGEASQAAGDGPPIKPFTAVVMNLPATAIEFLDVFRGLYADFPADQRESMVMPMIHCYGFSAEEDYRADAIARSEQYLGGALEEPIEVHDVRNVAPKKIMICISFRLPRAIAFAEPKRECEAEDLPAAKKPRS